MFTRDHWKKELSKRKGDELGSKRKSGNGGNNSDRVSLETAGKQEQSA